MLIAKQFLGFMVGILLLNTSLYGQIVTDGTLGAKTKTNLTQDPNIHNIQIPADLGQSQGINLFHSFQDFNINTGQTVTFAAGPNTIQNVLARVTGGQRSLIEGTLGSEIPNLYLLNPYGITFGKGAKLDVSSSFSFHASTADYIRLGTNDIFYANPAKPLPVLAVAPPSAFGFLNSQPVSIEVKEGAILEVSKGNNLSMIGGDLTIHESALHAPGGRINLVSVASTGKVELTQAADWVMKDFKELGTIDLRQQSRTDPESKYLVNIDVSAQPGVVDSAGQVFIRAGLLSANNFVIFADTYGDGGLIDISVGGPINLINSTKITADNYGSKVPQIGEIIQPGLINIKAAKLFVGFRPEELSEQLLVNNGLPSGKTITEVMQNESLRQFFLKTVSSRIGTLNHQKGVGGNIKITTPSLEVSYGLIESATTGSGNAGNVQINASQVDLHDYGYINASVGLPGSDETVEDGHGGWGNAGDINIASNKISLSNYSSISASTVKDSRGNAGNVVLKTQELALKNGVQINSFSEGEGNAGLINIEAGTALLTDHSAIYTKADLAGGGDINLQVHDYIALFNSKITTASWGVQSGDAGKLNISNFKVLALDKSQLIASANGGHGGKITAKAGWILGKVQPIEHLNKVVDDDDRNKVIQDWVKKGYSVMDATSLIDGQDGILDISPIRWEFPNLKPLDRSFWRDELSLSRCALFSSKKGKFFINARDVLPPTPEDWRTHSLRWLLGR